MIGRIDEVVIDCAEPLALARFWSGVLGGEARQRDEAWCYVDPPGWTRLAFQLVSERKTVKNRLHLDVTASDLEMATKDAEALGATAVGEIQRDTAGSFQVLLDPEGNEWCLVQAPPPRPFGSRPVRSVQTG
jgi:Glyoxalase-like domain